MTLRVDEITPEELGDGPSFLDRVLVDRWRADVASRPEARPVVFTISNHDKVIGALLGVADGSEGRCVGIAVESGEFGEVATCMLVRAFISALGMSTDGCSFELRTASRRVRQSLELLGAQPTPTQEVRLEGRAYARLARSCAARC